MKKDDPDLRQAITRQIAEKMGPSVEPSIMALVAAIGRVSILIQQEIAVMAKGFAADGMTLQQFAEVLTGEMEQKKAELDEDEEEEADEEEAVDGRG